MNEPCVTAPSLGLPGILGPSDCVSVLQFTLVYIPRGFLIVNGIACLDIFVFVFFTQVTLLIHYFILFCGEYLTPSLLL